MLKVVFYSRVSTDEEKQLNALDKQIQELTDYIHSQKDWVLVDKYIDEGISGTTSKGRYEYNRLYNDLLTDKFDIVVIKDQSRLMRNVLDKKIISTINNTGGCLIPHKRVLQPKLQDPL